MLHLYVLRWNSQCLLRINMRFGTKQIGITQSEVGKQRLWISVSFKD